MAIKRRVSGLDAILGEAKEEKKLTNSIEESRTTLQIRNDLLEKIRAISYWDRVLLKDIVNIVLTEYVNQYENKNGKIKPVPEKGKPNFNN